MTAALAMLVAVEAEPVIAWIETADGYWSQQHDDLPTAYRWVAGRVTAGGVLAWGVAGQKSRDFSPEIIGARIGLRVISC